MDIFNELNKLEAAETKKFIEKNSIGRYSDLHIGCPEISELEYGMDFRKPEYRREVFLRFYEFHCKYGSHPGAVYYVFPWLFKQFGMTTEQKLWFCFINGLSQNVITTFRLWKICPDPGDIEGLGYMFKHFRDNYIKFGWDTDRRYVKNSFEKTVEHYVKLLNGKTQQEFFSSIYTHSLADEFNDQTNAETNFGYLWDYVMENFYLFGRLSTFSYLEYLSIAGLPIICDNLFINDIDGSKSHRNGLCKVLGRDDLDWTKDNEVKYTPEILEWLSKEGEKLINDANARNIEANYFTLESTLCCFKSWFRKNRRYPNVYNDMFYERILRDEKLWGVDEVNKMFRSIRQECLPEHLRMEDNFRDPGIKPEKQNHFRLTGEVIMMDKEWDCFKNKFNDYING